jgi:asparagine synthase (glutamine-hydrolysing)
MCGISIVVRVGNARVAPAHVLERLHGEIAHRGPDGEGWMALGEDLQPRWAHAERFDALPIDEHAIAAAAFRWLRIQDLDPRSAQPLATDDRRCWIVFNGEIYNHAALRRELEGLGEVFRTASDTEVALLAYRRWGTDAFARFHGMWGMAIFDLARRELILSRDRLGIKPLYFAIDGGWLMLSSEPQAIARAAPGGARAEPFRVHEFLRGLPPQSAELSFFKGVHPFPAGCWARVPLGQPLADGIVPQRYWDLASIQAEPLSEASFEQTRAEFEHLLVDALESHAEAAVEIGALLSGGLDTSILARMLADYAGRRGAPPPKTFSIIFEDPAMSEWPYMQLVLARGGLKGINQVLTADLAWESTASVVSAQGQPLLGQDTVAQFHAYRLARQHGATVVIEGQGSDEMLAGMPGYDAQSFPEMLRRGQWLRFARELRTRRSRYRLGWRQALSTYVVDPIKRQRMEDRGLPRYGWLERTQVDSSRYGAGRTDDSGPGTSALQRFLYRHVRHTNLPTALMYQDRSSMANGIESRVPFLDHRLVEFAFRLPDSFKVSRGIRKRILLETARKYLPEAIVERRDKRIFISRTNWMDLRGRRAAEVRDMASCDLLRDFGLFRPAELRRFVEGFLKGEHQDEMAIWRMHSFRHWLHQYGPAL